MKAPTEGTAMKPAIRTPNCHHQPKSESSFRWFPFPISDMKNLQRLLLTATLLAAVLTTATPASGALKTWNGTAADTFWSSGGNWSAAGAPERLTM